MNSVLHARPTSASLAQLDLARIAHVAEDRVLVRVDIPIVVERQVEDFEQVAMCVGDVASQAVKKQAVFAGRADQKVSPATGEAGGELVGAIPMDSGAVALVVQQIFYSSDKYSVAASDSCTPMGRISSANHMPLLVQHASASPGGSDLSRNTRVAGEHVLARLSFATMTGQPAEGISVVPRIVDEV